MVQTLTHKAGLCNTIAMDKTIPQTPLQPPLRQTTSVQELKPISQPTLPIDTPSSQPVLTTNSKFIIGGTGLLLIFFLSVVIVINGNHNRQVMTLPAQQENTSSASALPTPIVSDTAPAIPMSQKAKIVVHHSDSSYETFLVPVSNESVFKTSMPPGDTIVQTIPPGN